MYERVWPLGMVYERVWLLGMVYERVWPLGMVMRGCGFFSVINSSR